MNELKTEKTTVPFNMSSHMASQTHPKFVLVGRQTESSSNISAFG